MRPNLRRRIRTKLVRVLLDLVVLHFLKAQPMHGYRIIANLRENFGVDLGSSTVYPLLGVLEEKGYVESRWTVENERPRKVYSITPRGSDLLNPTEKSLNLMFKKCRSIQRMRRIESSRCIGDLAIRSDSRTANTD